VGNLAHIAGVESWRINGCVEVRGVGVYEEVGRFGCGTGVVWEPPFVSEPEHGVPHRVVLWESTGGKRG
jgi:hypothetical protein